MDKEKIQTFFKTYKIHIYIIFISICVFLLLMFFLKKEETDSIEPILETKEEKKEEKKDTYFVDIKGAITSPSVYEMEKESRILDVIKKAGGVKENANTEYINLGKKITDEMVIIIYTNEEIKEYVEGNKTIRYIDKTCICPEIQNDGCIEKGKTVTNKKQEESESININSAEKEQLETLPGIGSSKANAIIEYRKKTPFHKIEDIKNIKGIGDSIFEKIKNRITV